MLPYWCRLKQIQEAWHCEIEEANTGTIESSPTEENTGEKNVLRSGTWSIQKTLSCVSMNWETVQRAWHLAYCPADCLVSRKGVQANMGLGNEPLMCDERGLIFYQLVP